MDNKRDKEIKLDDITIEDKNFEDIENKEDASDDNKDLKTEISDKVKKANNKFKETVDNVKSINERLKKAERTLFEINKKLEALDGKISNIKRNTDRLKDS